MQNLRFGTLNRKCKEKNQFCVDVLLIHFVKNMCDDILLDLCMKNEISQMTG